MPSVLLQSASRTIPAKREAMFLGPLAATSLTAESREPLDLSETDIMPITVGASFSITSGLHAVLCSDIDT